MKRPVVQLLSAITVGLATALAPIAAHAAPEVPAAAPGTTDYAALGDSYAAGYGIASRFELSGTIAQLCARSSKAYPVRLDDNRTTSPSFDFAACSGAITTDIMAPQSLWGGASAPAQDSALAADTDVVTLTVGGNDIGFGDAARCLQSSAPGCTLLSTRIADGLAALATPGQTSIADPVSGGTVTVTGLPTVLADILWRAPNAQVYVSNYPVLLAGCGSAYDSLNQANETLNSVIEQVTTATGATAPRVHFVDVADAFAGHDVCSTDPWISSTNLHPTIAGQVGFANAFRKEMRSTSGH